LSLQGTATGLKTGDWLLIVAGKQRGLSRVVSVKPDMEAKATYVGLNPFDPPPFEKPDAPAFAKGRSSDFAQRTLDEKAIKEIVQKTWAEDDLLEVAQLNEWPVEALTARIVAATKSMGLADDPHVIAFRQRAPLFGYNAPKPSYGIIRKCGRLVGKLFGPSPVHEWKLDDTESQTTLFLDNAYNAILPGDYIAIEKPDSPPRVLKVATVAICPRTAYGLSSKTTRLTVEEESWWVKLLPDRPTLKDFRDVTVHIQAERQTLAGTPIKDYLKPGELSVTLDRLYLGLQPGRQVILQGELSDLKGIVRSELLVVKRADVEGGFTVLTFEKGLQNGYLRNTASLNANVANATHGETVEEVLGSGDPTAAHQQFTLRRQPLTYTSAATTDGIESTLEIRVNGIQWHETKRLRNAKEHDRVFVTRVNDEGYTIVEFGDGETGARLPAGVENVQAKYRVGIGRKPRMKAGQLSQLMTRPLGVRAVTNPWPASGGDDSQSQDEVRQYAPLSLLTFGRLVALKDYEDFVRTFPGIAKANAISMTDGAPGVFITIAGADGAEVGPDTNTYLQLTAALKRFGDPRLRVKVKSCQQMTFKIEARVAVNPDFIPAQVLAAVKEKLENTFSFSARAFGQHVTSSEVIAVMQSVPGVTSLCLQKLAFTRDDTDKVKLPAAIADGKSQKAAELLTLGVTSLMEMEESR